MTSSARTPRASSAATHARDLAAAQHLVRQIDVTRGGERLVQPVRPIPARVQGLPDQRPDTMVIGGSHEHVRVT